MKIKYGTETIESTPRFEAALVELMKAKCEMMIKNYPEDAECWTWGLVKVGDIAEVKGLRFELGGDEDRPEGARFQVISEI